MMTDDAFWSHIANARGYEKGFGRIFKRMSDDELLEFESKFSDILADIHESRAMEDLEDEIGYTGDFVDYVAEGLVALGRAETEAVLNGLEGLDRDMENEGIILWPLVDEMDRRGVEPSAIPEEESSEEEEVPGEKREHALEEEREAFRKEREEEIPPGMNEPVMEEEE